jgi:hypothetical protein
MVDAGLPNSGQTMKQALSSLPRSTSIAACALAALGALQAFPSRADGINTTSDTCNVLTGANIPAGALQYVGGGRFSRQINRQISTANPKVYPFRILPNTTAIVTVQRMQPPDGSNWTSNRPATMEVQQPDGNGGWTTVCTKTENANNPSVTCNASISQGQARVKMSTTNGANANDDKAAFTLTYNFAGPATPAQAEQQSTLLTTEPNGLSVNQTVKATITGTSVLPGAFAGQALRLIITRSDIGVVTDPNGPKLKGNDTAAQDDGTDFVCTNWFGSVINDTRICEVVGTAFSDSTIHVPFQLAPNTAQGTHWGRVEVQRQFANGYAQEVDASKTFAKTCY